MMMTTWRDICETRSQCDIKVGYVNCACSSLLFVSYLLLAQLRGSGRARRRWATTIAAPSNRSVNSRSMMATVRSLFLQQADRNIWNTPTLRARPCQCARGHMNMVLSSQLYFTSNIKSSKCWDRPCCPPSLLYNRYCYRHIRFKPWCGRTTQVQTLNGLMETIPWL